MKEYIEDFCEKQNYDYYPDYSGRFMYGRLCVGIVCPNVCECIIQLCVYLQKAGVVDIEKHLIPVRYDNMGRDMIVYFPDIA